MERLSAHQRNTKQAKAKKKPIRVVYISNPMKVTTSAADFRHLVQELTGQDSNVADLSRFPTVEATGHPPPAPKSISATPRPKPGANQSSDPCDNALRRATNPFEMLDEAFNPQIPQMLENLQGFSPSPPYYEPQNNGFRDYDASQG